MPPSVAPPEPSPAPPPARGPAHDEPRASVWTAWIALGLAVASLCLPALTTGIWDPHELHGLELARRIAVGLYGASELALQGLDNALPTRGEVDRGELPFTSMALGLRVFGLHAAAARVVLLVWAAGGVLATFVLVKRLAGRKAAALSAVALATMPLYFVHARTVLGDIVTMAAAAAAVAGILLALFDRASPRARAAWCALGLGGLIAGAFSRGLLLGVAVPALSPVLAWALLRAGGAVRRERAADAIAATFGLLGGVASGIGSALLARALAEPFRFFPGLGFGVAKLDPPPTFDVVVAALGHALFPWSALLPFALGSLLVPSRAVSDEAREREQGLRLAMLLLTVLGLAAFTWLAPAAGVLPFAPVFACAVSIGLALRDLDLGAAASRAASVVVLALLAVFVLDFKNLPDKALVAFGVEGARFPESFREAGLPWLLAGAVLSGGAAFLGLLETDDAPRPAFAGHDYLAWLRTVRDLWNGNLLFALCVAEAALLGFFAFDVLGERLPVFRRFAAGGDLGRFAARTAWLVLPVVLALPFASLAARDAARALAGVRGPRGLRALVPGRGTLAALGFVVAGAGLSLGYYPALAAQLSPQDTFESFLRLARPGEPLGMVGASSATAPYSAGRSVAAFANANDAYDWLVAPGPRRWLVLRADALPSLNSRHRSAARPRANLPILDARSSEMLLASNRLLPGETNANPFERLLLVEPPAPSREVSANLGEQLDVLGWDVTDLDGVPVPSVTPGRRYELVLYFAVTGRITSSWDVFVHIDGGQRRHNADHPALLGKYPLNLLHVGDIVADRHVFALDPHFSPGEYRLHFGLYAGSRRMPVRRGPHSDDRIDAGRLLVE